MIWKEKLWYRDIEPETSDSANETGDTLAILERFL